MKKVCIYQRVLPHYRVPFFDALYEDLKKRGVSLNVVAGFESDGCVPKTVIVDKPWVEYRKNRYISLFGKEIVLQKFSLSDAKCDGVIVEQSNRLLINYFLMVLRFLDCGGMGKIFNLQLQMAFERNLKCLYHESTIGGFVIQKEVKIF